MDSEYSSRNPEYHQRLESRIQVPLKKTGIQYLESWIHSVESRIQDCPGFPYIGRAMIATEWINQWRIPGKGPGGPPPLFLDQTKALRVCTTAPLPYLKVWIRQCRPCLLRCFVAHLGHSIQEMGSIVWNTFIIDIMLVWTLHFQREKGIKSLRNIRLLINLG